MDWDSDKAKLCLLQGFPAHSAFATKKGSPYQLPSAAICAWVVHEVSNALIYLNNVIHLHYITGHAYSLS